jgi:hypothetical protein
LINRRRERLFATTYEFRNGIDGGEKSSLFPVGLPSDQTRHPFSVPKREVTKVKPLAFSAQDVLVVASISVLFGGLEEHRQLFG